jgi:hypothetical protein
MHRFGAGRVYALARKLVVAMLRRQRRGAREGAIVED